MTDVLAEAAATCDWRPFRALFSQYSLLIAQGADADRVSEVYARLAESLAGTMPSYFTCPAMLLLHAWAQVADIRGHDQLDTSCFNALYRDQRFALFTATGWRRPSPFETVVETCRRLRTITAISEAMAGSGTSGIVCGSVAYGPFYCVRGNIGEEPASDLDLVMATTAYTDLPDVGKRLNLLPGISSADVADFVSRARIFSEGFDDGRTALSQKFRVSSDGEHDPLLFQSGIDAAFPISVHIVPPELLAFILVESSTSLVAETAGIRRHIYDYRNQLSDRPDQLHGFDGRRYRLLPDSRRVEGGSLRRTSAYHIDDFGRYYPGFYQTVIQPKADLPWDELRIQFRLDQLRRKLAERLRFERQRDPYSIMRPSLAHLRCDRFAPNVVRQLDEMYSPN